MARRENAVTSGLGLAAVALVACASQQRTEQLENVAKDWSLTIRASQVIPVYPLTEDLRPGDVFLVLTSIQNQAKAYEEDGFLPLDQHMTRLKGIDYSGFYRDTEPSGVPASSPDGHDQGPLANVTPQDWRANGDWKSAPRAAFPAYSFEVRSGAGFNSALPIQGVPVGLSLMQTDSATGTVTIADSYTYGVGFEQLSAPVRAWAQRPDIHDTLRRIRKAVDRTIYLRVVTRVYLAQRVVVSLTATEAGSARADVGAPKELGIAELAVGDNTKNYGAALTLIQDTVKTGIPGGSVGVAWASDRSVSMSETFPHPLVIGYLGFDFPILADGRLGAPVATRDQLQTGEPGIEVDVGSGPPLSALRLILDDVRGRADRDPRAQEYLNDLARFAAAVPTGYPVPVFVTVSVDGDSRIRLEQKTVRGAPVPPDEGLDHFLTYYGTLRNSLEAIDDARANDQIEIPAAFADSLAVDRSDTEAEIARLARQIGSDDTVTALIAYWWAGYQD